MTDPLPVEAAPALPGLLRAGVAAFDRGDYWHAHEHWEEPWRHAEGPTRHFLQGLIQLAAALHHIHRGRHDLGLKLLGRAHAHLRDAHPAMHAAIGDRVDAVSALVGQLRHQLLEGQAPTVPPLASLLRA